MEPANTAEYLEKDHPLREDIRLLGRILGDTVSQQEGAASFAIVEHIRQSSVRFHREDDETARHELEATLNSLSRDQTIPLPFIFMERENRASGRSGETKEWLGLSRSQTR